MTMNAACQKKRGYPTHGDACRTMRRMWARKIGAGKLPCRAYACRDCGKYHLTSMPRR